MRIAVLCHASAGGSGVVATELGIEMSHLGNQVHFVGTHLPFRLGQHLMDCSKLFFHQVGSYAYPLFEQRLLTINTANALTDVILQHDIQIVHAHYAIPHATSALMAQEMAKKSKVITTLHGTDVTLVGIDPAFKHSTRHSLERSNTVTAVSHYLAAHTLDSLGLDVPIQVIHNMVDTQRFVPIQDAKLRARFAHPDEMLVVHVSNFRKLKRTEDVIEVFAKLSSELPARLLMIGDGPERAMAFELAQSLGVIGRVSFLGSFPNIESILGICDLFLLLSSEESFGLVALEAMSCEVPVIATRIGGIPEVVRDGETGYLFPLGDTDAMAHQAIQLLSNPLQRRTMGQQARHIAETHFHPNQIMPQYLKVYQELL